MTPELLAIAEAFDLEGTIAQIAPLGRGLINDTYKVQFRGAESFGVVLQRINTRVFHEPSHIMANIQALCAAARSVKSTLKIPSLVHTRSGQLLHIDSVGGFWRAMTFIPNTRNISALQDLDQARDVGQALGLFHRLISTLDNARLHVTLPGFHIAPQYLAQYDAVSRDAKSVPPLAEWAECAAYVERGRARCSVLEDAKRNGILPLRATHGDPKLDNFLFDMDTGHVTGLIDLDTLQPGLIHYDIGDCIRSSCNISGESVTDLNTVRFDFDSCAAILRGYVSAAKAILTPADYRYMYDAIRLIPWELGLRFLTDHLAGDCYFKVNARGQNLHRARVQFKLCEIIETRERDIVSLVDALACL